MKLQKITRPIQIADTFSEANRTFIGFHGKELRKLNP